MVIRDSHYFGNGGCPELQTSDALGAANSQIGPDAQALAVLLNKNAGLSHGKISRFFQDAFGIRIVRATPARTMLRAAQRLLPAYGEIQIAVKNSAWTVPDETGWKVGGLLHWLHAFVTEHATLYLIRPSRGFDVPCEALGASFCSEIDCHRTIAYFWVHACGQYPCDSFKRGVVGRIKQFGTTIRDSHRYQNSGCP